MRIELWRIGVPDLRVTKRMRNVLFSDFKFSDDPPVVSSVRLALLTDIILFFSHTRCVKTIIAT